MAQVCQEASYTLLGVPSWQGRMHAPPPILGIATASPLVCLGTPQTANVTVALTKSLLSPCCLSSLRGTFSLTRANHLSRLLSPPLWAACSVSAHSLAGWILPFLLFYFSQHLGPSLQKSTKTVSLHPPGPLTHWSPPSGGALFPTPFPKPLPPLFTLLLKDAFFSYLLDLSAPVSHNGLSLFRITCLL